MAVLGYQRKRESESLLILRSIQALLMMRDSATDSVHPETDHERQRPLLLFLLAALEFQLRSVANEKLVLLSRRLEKVTGDKVDRLEESLKILGSSRYIRDWFSRGRKPLRNSAFPQRFWEGGDAFVKIVSLPLLLFLN